MTGREDQPGSAPTLIRYPCGCAYDPAGWWYVRASCPNPHHQELIPLATRGFVAACQRLTGLKLLVGPLADDLGPAREEGSQ